MGDKKKLKEAIKEFKQRKRKSSKQDSKKKKAKRRVLVGPKGGKYVEEPSGKKQYKPSKEGEAASGRGQHSRKFVTKSLVEDIIMDVETKIKKFLDKVKPIKKSEGDIDMKKELIELLIKKLEGKEDLLKGMFYEPKSITMDSKVEESKESVMMDLKYEVERMKNLKELSYLVEEELPEAKKLFSSYYNKCKSKAEGFIKKLGSMKKSEAEIKELETLEKAITGDAAVTDNKPVDEATLDGTNTPTIQDATTPTQEAGKQEEAKPEEAPAEAATEEPKAEAKPEEAKPEEVKESETPAAINADEAKGGKVTFAEGLFQEFTAGATLKQGPNGNVMTNMKNPKQDYVENAKNKKNVSYTGDDFKDGKVKKACGAKESLKKKAAKPKGKEEKAAIESVAQKKEDK